MEGVTGARARCKHGGTKRVSGTTSLVDDPPSLVHADLTGTADHHVPFHMLLSSNPELANGATGQSQAGPLTVFRRGGCKL
jgi:hypothetical protein